MNKFIFPNKTINLHDLISPFIRELDHIMQYSQPISISGISSDSRHAQKGDLFLALNGNQYHGLNFIDQLLEKEVSAILYDADLTHLSPSINLAEIKIPMIKVERLSHYLSSIAYSFYSETLSALKIIGITGTEGKTSVAQSIAQSLEMNGERCGYIGTNGIGRLPQFSQKPMKENTHTTPDLLSLLKALEALKQELGASIDQPKFVALEVTSHALDQKRIFGLTFEIVIFTNLNRDHLDYHKTIEEYGAAKTKLFTDYDFKLAIINADDPFARKTLVPYLKAHNKPYFTYGTFDHDNKQQEVLNFAVCHLKLLPLGLSFDLCIDSRNVALKELPKIEHQGLVQSQLYGHFMASNLMAVAGCLFYMESFIKTENSLSNIYKTLNQITTVQGRMQKVNLEDLRTKYPLLPTIIIDYAHKPNALLQVLITLKAHLQDGKLFCIFGCGGDRDKGKRPIMGDIADKNANIIMITSDNPRSEDSTQIIEDILSGISDHEQKIKNQHIFYEIDRQKAIEQVLSLIHKDDGNEKHIVLIAGKGHENYQIIGNEYFHFNDEEVVVNFYKTLLT